MAKRILLIEDDREISNLMCTLLNQDGFEVIQAFDGPSGESLARKKYPNVIVLDIMLPGKNGLDVLRDIRSKIKTPVIMLTAKGEAMDRIIGLELGADDYLPKPFNPRELIARIKALLRRVKLDTATFHDNQCISLNGFTLDRERMEVRVNDQLVELTHTEYKILDLLVHQSDRVVAKSELTEEVLDRKLTLYDRAIDMHVSNLRRKIPDTGIVTVRGVGYRLRTSAKGKNQ